MEHFMTAVTEPQTDIFCLFHDVGRPLVIQNVVHPVIGQNRLLDEHAAQLCLRGIKQVLDEILLHIHILVIQFTEILLVNISSGPHQSKFNESGHWRGHHEFPHTLVPGVHQQCLAAQVVQQLFRLILRCAPYLCRLFYSKRANRQQRHPFSLLFRIENLQYLIQCLRGRGSLGKPVDTVSQVPVCVTGCKMSHCLYLLLGFS